MDDHSAIGSADSPPVFSAQDEHFLRRFSETHDRGQAMQDAGMGADPANLDAWQAMEKRAQGILWRAEQMPLASILSAVGGDKVSFAAYLVEVCQSTKLHERIKGLQLLGRIHGAWDDGRRHPRARSLRLEPPEPRTAPRRVSNLPFDVGNVEKGD